MEVNFLKKHNFIIMRYSMLTNDGATWSIGRKDFELYKAQLFAADRLELHERLFADIALPSIANQSYDLDSGDVTLLILTSDELPSENLQKLQEIIKPYPWAKIIQLQANSTQGGLIKRALKNEIEKFNEEICYSTTRLDDDDALADNFLLELNKYVQPEFAGYAVSFGSGYAGIYDEDSKKFVSYHDYYYPKSAQGASHINIYNPETDEYKHKSISVFHNGNHLYTDKKIPTILDSRNTMFMRTFHSASDTSKDNKRKIDKIKSTEPVEIENVYKIFTSLINK